MFKLLPNTYLIVPALVYLLLLFGCGADETVNSPLTNTPLAENGATDVAPAPASSPYYPIALGNRWTYRNPDGSEWSREVAKLEILESERYHSFSYEPPIKLDSIGSAEYITYPYRLVRQIAVANYNDTFWQLIIDSGGKTQQWRIGMNCIDKCEITNPTGIFLPQILHMLYQARPHVSWSGKLTPLRFPLFPKQTHTALHLKLHAKYTLFGHLHEFYTDIIVIAAVGSDRELVETPAGAFQDCLKIQYEADPISIETKQFLHSEPDIAHGGELDAFELVLHDQVTRLKTLLMPKLGLQTMWLAPGVGPVKIETSNGIAELIDYEIKPVEE